MTDRSFGYYLVLVPAYLGIQVLPPVFYLKLCQHLFCIAYSYEDVFLDTLHNAGYKTPDDPCIIQCFDHDSLLYMKSRTELPCVQLSSVPVTDAMLDMYQENGFYGVGLSKVSRRRLKGFMSMPFHVHDHLGFARFFHRIIATHILPWPGPPPDQMAFRDVYPFFKTKVVVALVAELCGEFRR